MRDFALEVHFSRWEFNARHHMTASDMESMTLGELTQMAGPSAREELDRLWLGYTETWGAPDLREAIAATYAAFPHVTFSASPGPRKAFTRPCV